MAKGTYMLGKFRGKMGGQVFRVDPDAGQVVSVYNDSPRNPRTIAQTRQRAKMNLAGCFSKLTPYSAIAGLGGSRRAARSRFVSVLLKAASATASAAGQVEATFKAEKVKFGEGRAAIMTNSAFYDATDHLLTVSVANGMVEQNIIGARVIVYFFNGNEFDSCFVGDVSNLQGTTAQEVDFDVPVAYQTANGYAHVYVVPVWGDNADAVTLYNNVVVNTNNDEGYLATVMRTLVALNALGLSSYIGRTEFSA